MIESDFFGASALGYRCFVIPNYHQKRSKQKKRVTLAVGITIFYVTVRLTYLHSILLFIVPDIFN